MTHAFDIKRGETSVFFVENNSSFILSVKIVFILANTEDPDEMLPYGAFHLGLYCLPKYMYLFIGN